MRTHRQGTRSTLAVGQFVLVSLAALEAQQRLEALREAQSQGRAEYLTRGNAASPESDALLGPSRKPTDVPIEVALDAKYEELAELLAQDAADNLPLIVHALEELTSLQEHEARQIRQRYEASLLLPIDAGRKMVREAQDLYAKYAHLAGEDAPSSDGGET